MVILERFHLSLLSQFGEEDSIGQVKFGLGKSKTKAKKPNPAMKKLMGLSKQASNDFEQCRISSMGYSFDPRDHGESRGIHFAMYRSAAFDVASPIGSNSGYKWQPVSDIEWCRLFEKYWHNKRVTMSHSESYAVESNEGKPKIPRKGQGKRAGRGGMRVGNPHKKVNKNVQKVNSDDHRLN